MLTDFDCQGSIVLLQDMTGEEIPEGYAITNEYCLNIPPFLRWPVVLCDDYTLTVVPRNNTRFLHLHFVYNDTRYVKVTVRLSSGEEVVCQHLNHIASQKKYLKINSEKQKATNEVAPSFIFQGAKFCRKCTS